MLFFTLKKDRIVRPPCFSVQTEWNRMELTINSPDLTKQRKWCRLILIQMWNPGAADITSLPRADVGGGTPPTSARLYLINHVVAFLKSAFSKFVKSFLTFIFTHLPWVGMGGDALCLRRVMMTSTTALHCKLWSYMVQKCVLMESQTGSLIAYVPF